ncbi:MAG: hypothetical protein AB8B50_17735 [Pirellulaceae bacterium]
MIELLTAEVAKYGRLSLLVLIIHFAALFALVQFGVFIDSGSGLGVLTATVMVASAIGFGGMQMRSYVDANLWTYLLNRPASSIRLGGVLLAAATTILSCVFLVPPLVVTVLCDWLLQSVVDGRHYCQYAYYFGLLLSGYLAGCYLVLGCKFGKVLGLVFPSLLLFGMFQAWYLPLLFLVAIAWQFVLFMSVFKVDLERPSTKLIFRVANIAAFQLAGYLVLGIGIGFSVQAYQMIVYGAGITISWNEYFSDDTLSHLEMLDSRKKLAGSLRAVRSPEANELIQQVQLANVHSLQPLILTFPVRHQNPFRQLSFHYSLLDDTNGLVWRFSHDEMEFLPRAGRTDQTFLPVRSNGKEVHFSVVPIVSDGQVVTPSQIFVYDSDFQELVAKFQAGSHERLRSGIITAGPHRVVVTSHRVVFLDSASVRNPTVMAETQYAVDLNRSYRSLLSVDIAELLEEDLLGFLWDTPHETGQPGSFQNTVGRSLDGDLRTVASRPLRDGFPDVYQHRWFYASPGLFLIHQWLPNVCGGVEERSWLSLIFQSPVSVFLAAVSVLFSCVVTYLLARVQLRSKSYVGGWVCIAALAGPAGVVAFVAANPGRGFCNPQLGEEYAQ